MTLERWKELRRQQALRVANASRGKRDAEMEAYRKLDALVRLNEQAPATEAA